MVQGEAERRGARVSQPCSNATQRERLEPLHRQFDEGAHADRRVAHFAVEHVDRCGRRLELAQHAREAPFAQLGLDLVRELPVVLPLAIQITNAVTNIGRREPMPTHIDQRRVSGFT